jgi:NAD(P)-dependent dehydrogenase (short-subunit alcohol dehydrogenase family)
VIDSPGRRNLSHTDGEGLNAVSRNQVPLSSVGQPEEIARAVSFLASDESSDISGIEVCVDGGFAQV